MVSPISVPGNQTNTAAPNDGRRNSLSSASLLSRFSPPGGTSIAAAAALGSSPPAATNISQSASSTVPGFGTGLLGSPGLARSISHGKQIGQAPLMSPTSGGMAVVNDKGARAQGILRRLSLGSAARPNFGRAAGSSPPSMPPALDNSVEHTQTDITSTAGYFHTLPPPQNASASSSSGLAPANASKSSTSPSFYANPFSGAVLHEAHDEHDQDLVSGMTAFSIGKKGDSGDGFTYRRASSAVTGSGSQGQPNRQEGFDGLPQLSEHPEGTLRARRISFGWSGFMSGKRDANPHQHPSPPAVDRGNNTDASAAVPPSILVRRESAPVSPSAGRATLDDQSKFKFGSIETGENKVPVSVIVHPVSPSSAPMAQELEARNATMPMPSHSQLSPSRTVTSDTSAGTPSSNTKTSTKANASSSPSGLLGLGRTAGSGSRGRKGTEATGPGPGKKRSVSPMAEHLLRGGPGQF